MDQFLKDILRAKTHPETHGATLWDKLRRKYAMHMRGGWEQGGYVHDTAMSLYIPPSACQLTVGAWADTVGNVALTYMKRRTAAAATNQLIIPIPIPQNSVALKGGYLKSIDIWWELATATLTTLTALISRVTLPVDATARAAPAAPAFTYDALNTTNGLRVAIQKRMMTLTITAPFWLAALDQVYVDMTLVDPGTSVFDFYGARANYTFRI